MCGVMDEETFSKMVSGEWYNPASLEPERLRAQTICAEDDKRRWKLMNDLFGTVGEGAWVMQPFHCDYGRNIQLGPKCFLNYGCVMLDCAPILFGEHVLAGPGCHFYTAIHPTDPDARATDMERAEPIIIGNNVWLGGHVTVLPGVRIGDNTIVGAGSVVTKSLPANVIAVGNPARVIKKLDK